MDNTEENDPIAAQSQGTLTGLWLEMTILPMIVLALALVLFKRELILTDEKAREISEELHGKD